MLSRLIASIRKILGLVSDDIPFTLSVSGYQPVSGTLTAVDPLSLWYWIPPDQLRGEKNYQVTEYLTRECSAWENGCPGVVILGEAINHTYSRSVKWNKKLQYFSADLISLSRFGHHFTGLDADDRAILDDAFTYFYGNGVMLCNGDSGFGAPTPKHNYMTRQRGAELPTVDAYRRTTTDSLRVARYLDNPIITNSHGEEVLACDSWVLEDDDIPITVVEDQTYNDFMMTTYPVMVEAGSELLEQFTDEVFAASVARDQITFNYDIEILNDPRVAWACNQFLKGDVKVFQSGFDTPYPFVTRKEQPAYYPTMYLQGYGGDKKSLYYTVTP